MSYAVEHASAYADILAAGSAVTFTRLVAGAYDAATDTAADGGTVTTPGAALRVRGDPQVYLALGLIESEAPTLLFCPTTYGDLPDLEASVSFGGATYVVKRVNPVAPDGSTIIARLIVAGSGARVVGRVTLARPDITFAMAGTTLAAA